MRSQPSGPVRAAESHASPGALDPLQRKYLRESVRAISRIQTAVRKAWASGQVTVFEMP